VKAEREEKNNIENLMSTAENVPYIYDFAFQLIGFFSVPNLCQLGPTTQDVDGPIQWSISFLFVSAKRPPASGRINFVRTKNLVRL
jgi:hypothetical protein